MDTKNTRSQKVLKYIVPSIITIVAAVTGTLSIPNEEALNLLKTTWLSIILSHAWVDLIREHSSTILIATGVHAILIVTLTNKKEHHCLHMWAKTCATLIPIAALAAELENWEEDLIFTIILLPVLFTIWQIPPNNSKSNISKEND